MKYAYTATILFLLPSRLFLLFYFLACLCCKYLFLMKTIIIKTETVAHGLHPVFFVTSPLSLFRFTRTKLPKLQNGCMGDVKRQWSGWDHAEGWSCQGCLGKGWGLVGHIKVLSTTQGHLRTESKTETILLADGEASSSTSSFDATC